MPKHKTVLSPTIKIGNKVYVNQGYKYIAIIGIIGIVLGYTFPDIIFLTIIKDISFIYFICSYGYIAGWKYLDRYGNRIFLVLTITYLTIRLIPFLLFF